MNEKKSKYCARNLYSFVIFELKNAVKQFTNEKSCDKMVLSKKYMEVKTVSKKILAFILAACMTLSMTACGGSDSSDAETQSSSFSESESSESDDTSSDESSNESSETESFEVDSSEDESSKETKKTTKKETDDSSKVTTTKTTAKAVETTTQKPVVTTKPAVQTTKTTTKATTKSTTKTTTKQTTKVTSTQPTDNKYMAAMKRISKVNAHINKDFTESDCALVREYLIDLVYKKYPKSKAHNVKFIPYFDKNGKPSYYDNVLNNGGSYNGANWQYYYGINEGQIQMFIDDMTYLADVYMYNFDGEPCINGCTNWDIFWMYRSDGAVRFSLAVF